MKTPPSPIDIHVGRRLRLRRMLMGMSQEKLGERLGITFQQVQKYEKGNNRIASSRLFEIARIFSVPVQFFFDGFSEATESPATQLTDTRGFERALDFLSSSDGLLLNRSFSHIKEPALRRRVLDLIIALAGTGES